jgi:hypothetical protein
VKPLLTFYERRPITSVNSAIQVPVIRIAVT